MKKSHFLSILFLLMATVAVSQGKGSRKKGQSAEPAIRQYWFVLLTKGPTDETDSVKRKALFSKHMANIGRLYQKGILKVAGPFGDNSNNWEGIFIFDCASKAEAESLVQSDAAIAAGLLKAEILPWYTSAVDSFRPGPPQTDDESRSAFE